MVAIYVKGARVCGLMVTREHECRYTARVRSFEDDGHGYWRPTETIEVEPRTRRTVDMVWVLKAKRRQGIAREMVLSLARHRQMEVGDFAHMTPFRADALSLWKALGMDVIFVAKRS